MSIKIRDMIYNINNIMVTSSVYSVEIQTIFLFSVI